MKKVFSLLLALLMLVSVFAFAGCTGDDPKNTKETLKTEERKTTDTSDPNSVLDNEVKNLNGHVFTFNVRSASSAHLDTHEVYAGVMSGDKINDAVFARNSQLERDYHCTIDQVKASTDPSGENREALVAGEYITDFFFDTVAHVKTIMNTSLLADLTKLENIHLEKSWYDQGAVEGLTIDGRLFCVTGAMATLDDRACWVIFFNRDLVNDAIEQSTSGLFDGYKASGNEDKDDGFYRFIMDGKWTAEAMYEIMLATKDDKDGNGYFDPDVDVLGYVGEKANNWFHVLSSGNTVSQRQPNGDVVVLDTLPENLLQAWSDLKPIITSEYRYVSDAASPFKSGRCAFYGCNLGTVLTNSSMEINYGLAPMPKARLSQDYYYTAPSHQQFGVYCIPKTAAKAPDAVSNGFADGVEQAAYFLEAFGYYSVDTLTYAFYDQVVSKQLLQDQASRTTLAMALEHKVIDPVVLFLFGNLHVPFQDAGSPLGANQFGTDIAYDTLASKYEQRASGARNEFQEWRESLVE